MLSFTLNQETVRQPESVRRKVLVTGANGNIGKYFAQHSHHRYDLRLMVRTLEAGAGLGSQGEVIIGDLGDLETMKKACEGIDTVVHLAARASPISVWSALLESNIIGAYHTFAAAKASGCRRLVFASSIHAVSGYPRDVQGKATDPVNPGDLYGVTKCFGEALGRYMAEQEGLSVIVIRIGAFGAHPKSPKGVGSFDAFISERDMNQLIERCIDDERVRFAIVNGLSDNSFKRLDISDARELLGYAPVDDYAAEHPILKELDLAGRLSSHNMRTSQKSGLREDI
jgi:nucleoside-diphosphate-sugar epimerase